MDGARDQLLADAALAEDEDGGVGRRRTFDGVADLAQRRTLADHLVPRFRRAFQRAVLVLEPALAEHVADRDQQPLRAEGFLDEIVGAAFGRVHADLGVPVRRNHDHGQRLVDRLDLRQGVQAVHAGHLDVEEHDVR